MPLISALNGDTRIILTGAPVAGKFSRLQLDRVVLAGGTRLAAGLVKSGSNPNGVVNILTEGILDLPDWTAVAGSKYLTVGSAYRLSNIAGKITTTGTGQILGLAVSKTQLTLQISSSGSSSGVSTSIPPSISADLAAETNARIAADASLGSLITSETNARIVADAALQAQINSGAGIQCVCGSVLVGNGLDSGTVSNLGTSIGSAQLFLSVSKPIGGLNLSAESLGGFSANEFTYLLSGETDSANYRLHYLVIPSFESITSPNAFICNGFQMPFGTHALAIGATSGTVSGLGLPSGSYDVFPTIRKPEGGFNLFATIVGTPTSDGFDFELNGSPDVAGYVLEYLIGITPTELSFALPINSDSGTVTGLGLSYVPSGVLLRVTAPIGGERLFANSVGSPTADD